MLELILQIFSSGFEYVYVMLNTIKIDSVSFWSLLIVFILGSALIKALLGIFNPTGAASTASGFSDKYDAAQKKAAQKKKEK